MMLLLPFTCPLVPILSWWGGWVVARMGSVPHLAGFSEAESMGTGQLRGQCSPQRCGESSFLVSLVEPALAYSMIFCCHWQEWDW